MATLHAAFQVGLNIHTLAYALMLVVIVSGVVGVVAYLRVPRLMTENRMGQSLGGMALEMLELDRQCVDLALGLGDEYALEVQRSRRGDPARRLDQTAAQRARPEVRHDPGAGAGARAGAHGAPGDSERAAALVVALGRKQEIAQRARRDIRIKALMDLWLYFHVPLSFALLAALIAHVVAVFFYWG